MKKLYTCWIFLTIVWWSPAAFGQCSSIAFSADITNGCAPSAVKFTATGYPAGSRFSWNFGGGYTAYAPVDSIKYFLFKNVGQFTIELNVDIGGTICNVTKTNYINVGTKPKLNVYWDKKVLCDPTQSVTFIDSTQSVVSRDWIIDGVSFKNGPTTKVVKFNSTGVKQLTLKVLTNLGCVAIFNNDSAVIVVDNPNLYVDSIGLGGCLPVQNKFKAFQSSSFQTPKTWEWTFQGGTPATSTQQSPTVNYTASGQYDFLLTMTTNTGCKYTFSRTAMVEVVSKPKISFSSNGTFFCNTDEITVTNTTIGSHPGQFSWGFPSNATLISATNTESKFKIPLRGTYDISFHYLYKNCASDTIYKNYIKINQTTADFKIDEPKHCKVPAIVTFTDSGSFVDPGFTYTRMFYVKDSGGNILDSSSNGKFAYTFTKFGNYTIQMVAKGSNGCTDTMTKVDGVVIDDPKPNFNINPTIPCPFTLTDFSDVTPLYAPSKYRKFYDWYLYDRDFKTLLHNDTNEKWKYFFVDTGLYKIVYWVFNSQGCRDSILDTTTVHVTGITVDFTVSKSKYCIGENISVSTTVYPTQATPTFFWKIYSAKDTFTFNNAGGGLSTPINTAGVYSIECVAININCTATVLKKDIFRIGGVLFTGQVDSFISCNPPRTKVSVSKVYNLPTTADSSLNIVWTVSPSTVVFSNQTGSSTYIDYTADGFYSVAYSVTNSDGCESSQTIVFNKWYGRSAKFDLDTLVCVFDSITVTDMSQSAASYAWSVPSGGSYSISPSSVFNAPSFTFKDTGLYTIRLLATNGAGCVDTFERTVHVVLLKANFYTQDTLAYCGPVIVSLFYTGTNASTYIWDFGDGSPQYTTTTNSISHLYDIQNGINSFKVTVRAQNKSGCYDEITKNNYITLIGPIPFFTADITKGCEPLEVTYTNKSRGGKYVFFYDDKGNLDSSNASTFVVSYQNKDTGNLNSTYFPYMVSIDSSGGCVKAYTLKDSLIVLARPQVAFTYSDTIVCRNANVDFTNLSTYFAQLFWDVDGDGYDDGSAQNFQHSYSTTGFYQPALVASNQLGCFDTLKGKAIFVIPPKDIKVKAKPMLSCQGDTVRIVAQVDSLKALGLFFNWQLLESSNWIGIGNGNSIDYIASKPGWYRVMLIVHDLEGCVDSIQYDSVFGVKGNEPPIGSKLQMVTVENDKRLLIKWYKCPSLFFSDYKLFRSAIGQSENLIFSDSNVNLLQFTDSISINVHAIPYRYKLIASEICVLPKIFELHNSIFLQAEKLGSNTVSLKWNRYQAWKGHVSYSVQRSNNGGIGYKSVGKITDSFFVDKRVCDSNYTYRIVASDVTGIFTSTSNTTTLHPDFVYYRNASNIRSVSVVNNDKFLITYDTTLFSFRSERYIVLQTNPNYKFWYEARSSIADTAIISKATIDRVSRFAVVREDFCHYLSDTGIWGHNIYLKARLFGDSSYLNWNSYQRPKQGVKNYILQLLDNNTGRYKTLAILSSNDTDYLDARGHDLFEEKLCYRIAAITLDYPKDTSFSNQACVVLPAMVFIPNSFTPNDDGKNDIFRPVISYVFGVKPQVGETEYTLTIYNRWGEQIYETHDPREGWDGTYRGVEVGTGVYVYTVKATPYNLDVPIERSGLVMLLR